MALFVDIEKKLGNFLLDVSFEADRDVLALLGASGCGKSMTLKCIAGIERPDSGRIVLDGRVLFDSDKRIDLPPQKRRVGYLFQQYALFPNMTVEQNVACGVRDKSDRPARAAEMIKMMHLEGTEKKKPAQLSGGQQQRVALARILVNDPEVLLLDEPFSALDAHLRFSLEQQVREVIESFGRTVLLVSHDRDEAFRIASHIAVMRDGRIETMGEKHEVFAAPLTVNGARLTGCKNITPARVLEDGRVLAEDWGLALAVSGETEGLTHIGIRMHDVAPCENENEENAALCAVVEEIENPFSVTVMLRPYEEAQGLVGMELPKETWAAVRAEKVLVRLPAEAIITLKE
ncbi:MAG: sulfate/molybdate ABC transporter ATP-binding protein [Oscillospiraceae bacterium]|nr:sulfate/molybdate ABC transporter ATP-binding protein [Oscillospiraceae bacterium]